MRHYDFTAHSSTIPDFWLDNLQEFISTIATNFLVKKASSNSIQVVAGAGNDKVCIGIEGRFRFNEATVNAAHPGGAAGNYDMWVTGSDNDFSGTPPNVDQTVYAFALAIRAVGNPPTTAIKRKVGYVEWTGTEIAKVVQTVGDLVGSNPAGAMVLQTIGTGALRVIDVTHNLGSRNVIAFVRQTASPYEMVYPQIEALSDNVLRLTFDAPPAAGSLIVGVMTAMDVALVTAAPHNTTHLAGGSDAIPWASIHDENTLALRPAPSASNAGYLYFATDVGILYRSTGVAWTRIAAGTDDVVTALPGSPYTGQTVMLRAGTTPYIYERLTYDGTLGKWVGTEWETRLLGAGGTQQNAPPDEPFFTWETTVATLFLAPVTFVRDYADKRAAGLQLQYRLLWAWSNRSSREGMLTWQVAGMSEGAARTAWAEIVNTGYVTLTTSPRITAHADAQPNEWRTLPNTWDAQEFLMLTAGLQSAAAPALTYTDVYNPRILCRWVSA